MAKSYFYDEGISDWRELVKGEQGERGPVGPIGPQGPAIDIETGLPISVDTSVGTRVFIGDVMIYGETRLPVHDRLINGWETGLGLYLHRENSIVTLSANNGANPLSGENATSGNLMEIPHGFTPASGTYNTLGQLASDNGLLNFNRNERWFSMVRGNSKIRGMISWRTSDDWPTES